MVAYQEQELCDEARDISSLIMSETATMENPLPTDLPTLFKVAHTISFHRVLFDRPLTRLQAVMEWIDTIIIVELNETPEA